ncbi:hypothetical protein [Pseudoduganella violacea]|uniref:Uncharacterized protein n=1 Tax=Pseudoduganella violacea TaxID=1715466 RepID=A0A7W5BEM0_9BURK|nr:hypothetical protein [Pseudoduganella violacea]MBB3121466.1 hypothetical protein [Pseudoduganella violacea]
MGYEAKQAVYLPTTDYLELELYLMDTRPGVRLDAFVTELVHRWLAIEMERLALRKNGQAMRGYQWKDLFLPDGTHLRTSHCGIIDFAKVVGDHIVSDDGVSLTPSQFANRDSKGRNAWRFVWVRYPGDEYWIRAANCRVRTDELRLRQSKATLQASTTA